ncbi:MAG: serine hydrolase domain-containing protein [Promethearchaeota archaeon]
MNLDINQLESFIEARMEELHIPGLGIGIVKDGKTIWSRGFGLADVEHKKAVKPDHVFRFASISKTFTTIGIMQLVEQGRLSLDDPINKFLSSGKIYPKNKKAPDITIKHLLTHTSGIGEILKKSDLFRIHHYASNDWNKIDSLKNMFERKIKLKVDPGVKWSYANFGFHLLGYILEKVSGTEFSDYMINNIFEPLGMNNTDFKWSERVKPHQVKGYKYKKGKFIEYGTKLQTQMPAGSLYASINDMITYMKCLLNGGELNGKKIIKKESLDLLWVPHFRMDPRLPAMGYCFFIHDTDGFNLLNHGGSINGYLSELYLLPREKLGIIIAINQNSIIDMTAIRIAHEILHRIINIESIDEEMKLVSSIFFDDKKYNGRYGPPKGLLTNTRFYMSGGEISIRINNGELWYKTMWGGKKKGVKLYLASPKDPNYFKIIENLDYDNVDPYEAVIFKENERGEIYSLLKGYREYYKRKWYNSFKGKLYYYCIGVILLIFTVIYYIIWF